MKKSRSILMSVIMLFTLSFTLVQCVNDPDGSVDQPNVIDEIVSMNDGYDYNEYDDSDNDYSEEDKISDEFISSLEFSDPIGFKNLQLFMVSSSSSSSTPATEPDKKKKKYVPLQEALDRGWVEIHETSEVNELEISNKSKETIYINAGDIIKGGKQDRTLAYDMILGPKEKHVKVESYCVESDRWTQRGSEDVAYFSESTKMISSREMKISTKLTNAQGGVWNGVSEQQEKLNENISYMVDAPVDVKDNASSSSLELTLDNEELQQIKKEYKAKFMGMIDENTIGFAYAINGELYNLDIYNDRALFEDLFDKLLDAAIVEAIAELDLDAGEFDKLSKTELKQQIQLSLKTKGNAKDLNEGTRWTSEEDDDKVIFTSVDKENKKWVHRNLIIKGDDFEENKDVEQEQLNMNEVQQIQN